MTTDAILNVDSVTKAYDFTLDSNGDISNADFFDTAILYSLFGERRASGSEVVEARFRRGWIGNADDFENGSKLWLFSQARLTRDILNRIQDEAKKSLEWLVEDDLAVSIDDVIATVNGGRVFVDIVIRRSRDKIIRRSYELWERTGNAT